MAPTVRGHVQTNLKVKSQKSMLKQDGAPGPGPWIPKSRSLEEFGQQDSVPFSLERTRPTASISSMKMMAGAMLRACKPTRFQDLGSRLIGGLTMCLTPPIGGTTLAMPVESARTRPCKAARALLHCSPCL